uniref:Uncharacterized protein n=1 Tax=Chlamydomonas chlamydogama TaxID=225041 RepID=A0A7S2VV12_9CHLO
MIMDMVCCTTSASLTHLLAATAYTASAAATNNAAATTICTQQTTTHKQPRLQPQLYYSLNQACQAGEPCAPSRAIMMPAQTYFSPPLASPADIEPKGSRPGLALPHQMGLIINLDE